MKLKVYGEIKTGTDGLQYSVRYLLTEEEARHMEKVGVIGPGLVEIVAMGTVADRVLAEFERDHVLFTGGSLQ